MNIIMDIFKSSLGKKYIMAVSGGVLFLFVVGHLAGNLQFFLGREAINRYGHFLQSNPELIWPARLGLLLMAGLHLWSAVKLSLENRAARPVGYAQYQAAAASYASRTMLVSGLIVLTFLAYHLLHFTVQVPAVNLLHQDFHQFNEPGRPGAIQLIAAPQPGSEPNRPIEGRHDVFKMMVAGFSNGWVSLFYLLGVGLLCLHLSHGASSLFQSLGWRNDAYRAFLDRAALVVAGLIFLGYASIPVAVLLGYGSEAFN